MNPAVAQILHRREEIATHQRVLKELEAALTEDEKKELAAASKSEAENPKSEIRNPK